MADIYLGQIIMAGFSYAPEGFGLCDGTLLPVAQNQALFSLLYNTFGGDGRTTFALPDMRGRTWVGMGLSASGTNYIFGKTGGSEGVALTAAQVPAHAHNVNVQSNPGTTAVVKGNYFASSAPPITGGTAPQLYAPPGTMVPLLNQVSTVGGGAKHNNMQPFLVINYAIATLGIYPSRNY